MGDGGERATGKAAYRSSRRTTGQTVNDPPDLQYFGKCYITVPAYEGSLAVARREVPATIIDIRCNHGQPPRDC
eukprot:858517-Pelagomonas_calceolata.AAC.1